METTTSISAPSKLVAEFKRGREIMQREPHLKSLKKVTIRF